MNVSKAPVALAITIVGFLVLGLKQALWTTAAGEVKSGKGRGWQLTPVAVGHVKGSTDLTLMQGFGSEPDNDDKRLTRGVGLVTGEFVSF